MVLLSALLTGLAVLVLLSRPGPGRLREVLSPVRGTPASTRSSAGAASGRGARSGGSSSARTPSGRGAARSGGSRPGRGAASSGGSPSGPTGAASSPGTSSDRTALLACLVAAAALALLVAWPVGPVLGAAVALGGPRLLSRLEPAGTRAERAQLAADLPLVLDLLSSCLAGGASLPDAARAVADAVPGPAGARLAAVSAQLAVGTPPAQAWAGLVGDATPAPGGPGRQALGGARTSASGAVRTPASADPLAPAARALGRAAEGGAPVAAAVARLAADARSQARAQSEQAARRVGVLVVAPLGLCFLPAFVLLGVVPVVAGLVGPLLDGL